MLVLASTVGLYVPIVLVLFAVFVFAMVRRRRPRDTEVIESGEGQRLEH